MKDGLHKDTSGWRRYLDGRAIHCGDGLELRVGDSWIPVRYEARLGRIKPTEYLYFASGWVAFSDRLIASRSIRWGEKP